MVPLLASADSYRQPLYAVWGIPFLRVVTFNENLHPQNRLIGCLRVSDFPLKFGLYESSITSK